jgi:hypothetical protein
MSTSLFFVYQSLFRAVVIEFQDLPCLCYRFARYPAMNAMVPHSRQLKLYPPIAEVYTNNTSLLSIQFQMQLAEQIRANKIKTNRGDERTSANFMTMFQVRMHKCEKIFALIFRQIFSDGIKRDAQLLCVN